jgi:hypothetical protein
MAFTKFAAFQKVQGIYARTTNVAAAFTATAFAVIVLLVTGGCRNEIMPGLSGYVDTGKDGNRGTGTVKLYLEDADPLQRTVKPSVGKDNFERYRLELTNADTGKAVYTEFLPEQWDEGFSLEAGRWYAMLEAFIANKVVARGESDRNKPIEVDIGQTIKATIELKPLQNGGQGTFVWNIDSATPGVSQATMEIYQYTDLNGDGDPGEVDANPYKTVAFSLKTDTRQALGSGEYMALATVEYGNGGKAIVSNIVHIYDNLDSKWNQNVEPSTSLLAKLLDAWNGTKWDFESGFSTDHLEILDRQLGSQLEGFDKTTQTAISKMSIADIKTVWNKYTIGANPVLKPGAFDLSAVIPLVDITNILKSFPAKGDGATWNSEPYDTIGKVEALAKTNAVNGTDMKFNWTDWDENDGVAVAAGAAGRYSFRVPIPVADRIEIVEANGREEVERGEVRTGVNYYFNVLPRGGWVGEKLTTRMEKQNVPSGITFEVDKSGTADYHLMVISGIPLGTTFELKATATRVDNNGNPIGDIIEEIVKFTVAGSPPPQSKLEVTKIEGNLDIYQPSQLKIYLKGTRLDIDNLDPMDPRPGTLSVDFGTAARPGALPGSSDRASDFPVGLAVSGSFTVYDVPNGGGQGDITLSGTLAYTAVLQRRVNLLIGGASVDIDLPAIGPKPTAQLAVNPVTNPPSVTVRGGEIKFDISAKNFNKPNGSFAFSMSASAPGPVLTITPSVPGLTVSGQMSNTGSTGIGSGTLTLKIPGGAPAGDYTLGVAFGDGSGADYASATTGFSIKDELSITYPSLEWPDVPGAQQYVLYAGYSASPNQDWRWIASVNAPMTNIDLESPGILGQFSANGLNPTLGFNIFIVAQTIGGQTTILGPLYFKKN